MGRRLGKLTANNTKCMIRVNGVRLIERMLDQLTHEKLARIILVIGYQGEKVCQFVGNKWQGVPIEYVWNRVYDQTNNIYSLWLAREKLLQDDTLLLESDLILDDAIIPKILHHPYPDLACVDKFQSWMDGTVVLLDENNRIQRFVLKKEFLYEEIPFYYKTVNIYKFSRSFSESHYLPFLEAYSHALGNQEYYEQVLRVIALLDNPVIKALPLEGERWYEIDDVQDLDIAESLFAELPVQLIRINKRYGGYWRYPQLLDYCYLVNPYFPNERLVAEMKSNFDTLLRAYPSGLSVNRLLASKMFYLPERWVTVGNGASELIKTIIGSSIGRLGIIEPTFEEYPNRAHPDAICAYQPANSDYRYGADDLISFFGKLENRIDTLVLINPDNPSGNYLKPPDVIKVIEWCAREKTKIIVDESFVDFTTEPVSLLQEEILTNYRNLVVVKSISKSYGVPGLRLGIMATSDEKLLEAVNRELSIWHINSFAEFFMQIIDKYEKEYVEGCSKLVKERQRFGDALSKVEGLRLLPSQANYFFAEVLPPQTPELLQQRLYSEADILIKNCRGKRGIGGRPFVRIAIRDKSDNDWLLESLHNL